MIVDSWFNAYPSGKYSHEFPVEMFDTEEDALAYINEVWEGNGEVGRGFLDSFPKSVDPVPDAISRATYLVEVARLAVLQLDIPKAKACLLEAATILEAAKHDQH